MSSTPTAREEWLTRLIDESGRDLLRFMAARLPNRAEAQDLMQEVYLRLLRVDDVGLIREPKAFALRLAANVAHEWRLLARNRFSHSDEWLDTQQAEGREPIDVIHQTQQMQRLARALETLSPVCRAVVLLHKREGMSYEQIAAHVGLSVGMVAKHLARGVAVCQQFLSAP